MKKLIISLAAAVLAPVAIAEDAKVELTGNDAMQFSSKAFDVTAGQSVSLTLKHIGKLPKAAMGHNVVILKSGTVVATFATKAMTAKDTDYIPGDAESKAQIVAHTKTIGGGESDTVTFTAPTEPGSYPFLCTFPGHFAVMQGVMTVKAK
ncbi:azurin [Luteolibacter ambystomatis]|uniref:Azurin n=1 Tax=Luteolibacter ambystomatis TaxID=2824561 RepID=A0A975IZ03_9BACT|nr:azurin [Luteolibacter ambystomatis]QUE50669.1 azurin [Luteolibacter ambystomatis]